MRVCVCVSVCARARACVCERACVCVRARVRASVLGLREKLCCLFHCCDVTECRPIKIVLSVCQQFYLIIIILMVRCNA